MKSGENCRDLTNAAPKSGDTQNSLSEEEAPNVEVIIITEIPVPLEHEDLTEPLEEHPLKNRWFGLAVARYY